MTARYHPLKSSLSEVVTGTVEDSDMVIMVKVSTEATAMVVVVMALIGGLDDYYFVLLNQS